MLDITQFREEIVRPALGMLQLWSKSAEELLVLTCAQESLGGMYLKQIKGPALGIYMMEPGTHEDLWNSWMHRRQMETNIILRALNVCHRPQPLLLKYNMLYATFMARMFYLRFDELLPLHEDINGLAGYYKKYWNTDSGKATVEGAIKNYNRFTGRNPVLSGVENY